MTGKRVFLLTITMTMMLVTWMAPHAAAQQNRRGKKYVATRAITVDQQTGALRLPTAEETQALVDRLAVLTNRSPEGLQPVALQGGGVMLNLEDRFTTVILARPNADGTSEIRCVTTFEEGADFLGLVEDPNQ